MWDEKTTRPASLKNILSKGFAETHFDIYVWTMSSRLDEGFCLAELMEIQKRQAINTGHRHAHQI